jgi:hypothetical protein
MFHIRTLCDSHLTHLWRCTVGGIDGAQRRHQKLRLRRIEALVHFSRWLKEPDGFLFDHHNGAGARVAAGMGSPPTRRKYPEAAEFNPVSSALRRVDRAQDRADETLNITLVETRILRGDAVDKLGFDHRVVPPRGYRPRGMAVPDSGRVVRFVASICSRRQPQQFASIGVELPGLTARSQSLI